MKLGPVVFILVAVGYFGFEVFMVSKNGYRTEPEFIFFDQFVSAAQSVEICGVLKKNPAERFMANYEYAKVRAANAIAEKNPDKSEAEIASLVDERELEARAGVQSQIQEKGCKDTDIWRARKRFENLARLNLG